MIHTYVAEVQYIFQISKQAILVRKCENQLILLLNVPIIPMIS